MNDSYDLDDLQDENELATATADVAELTPERPRAMQAANAIKLAAEEAEQFIDNQQQHGQWPGDSFLGAVHKLMEVVASRPDIGWNQLHWLFLDHCNSVATQVCQILVMPGMAMWPPGITKSLLAAFEEHGKLVDATPPEPHVVELETLEELLEQKVTPRQICHIYEWETEDGQADLKKFKLAKAGKLEPPTEKVFPVKIEGPPLQPHLLPVHECRRMFEEIYVSDDK